MPSITPQELRKYVHMQLERNRRSYAKHLPWLAVAFYGKPAWEDSAEPFEAEGLTFEPVRVGTLLELRERMSGMGTVGTRRLAVVVEWPPNQIPQDVRARLMHAQVHEVEPGRILLGRFNAVRVDPRLPLNTEIALALLEREPAQGFDPLPTGMLDAATFWGTVNRLLLGLPTLQPTAREVLLWAGSGETQRFAACNADIRQRALASLAERDPLAALLLKIIAGSPATSLIPAGLCAEVLFHPDVQNHRSLGKAEERFTRHIGGLSLSSRDARAWAEEARRALRELPPEHQDDHLQEADRLLAELGAADYADWSDILPSGLSARFGKFAEALGRAWSGGANSGTAGPEKALLGLQNHLRRDSESLRVHKAEMALRLLRWLRTPKAATDPQGDGVETTARLFRDESAFTDWARTTLSGGDPLEELARLYQQLSQAALERREVENHHFAERMASWMETGHPLSNAIPIENALESVVPSLVRTGRGMLVLVLDGLSWPIAQELVRDLERSARWTARNQEGIKGPFPHPVLSVVPSVTEFARNALLTGRLGSGGQHEERKGFAAHPALRTVSTTSYPPVLFHKGDLEEEGRQGLARAVSEALNNSAQRVVGIVMNSVDDFLAKDPMRHTQWSVADFRLLPAILAAAERSKRAILLCSDHGHILSSWTTGSASPSDEGGERWHRASPLEGELAVSGRRAEACLGPVSALWTERRRYRAAKNGYHGGISPQEIVAPFLVLVHAGEELEGWSERHLTAPAWWEGEPATTSAAETETAASPRRAQASKEQVDLFETTKSSPTLQVPGKPRPAPAAWVDAVLQSEIFAENARLIGRRRAPDSVVAAAIRCLDASPDGRATERDLAQAVDLPEMRIRGLMAQLQRLLNLDGYPVIGYTLDGGQLKLDRELLRSQFGIEERT
jgi:hypothetical protein